MRTDVQLGLDRCLHEGHPILLGKRFGLLVNQASVDAGFRYSHELLNDRFPGQLAALFGPQHGMWSEQQDNMIETGHTKDPRLGIPIYSLYADSRKPSPEMLEGLDVLVVDLQDVGTRVYTYIWTLSYCLEACAEKGIALLVLDRPNPLGGLVAEGRRLDPAYQSFVGRASIPMRHALTMGEMALFLNTHMDIGAEVHVQEMQGWTRSMLWPETGRSWIPTSPNLPRWGGVQLYPGMVLLEGCNLSEGRGTTTPFEVLGAPWLDPIALLDALGTQDLPGLHLRPISFEPTFQKHMGQSCGGLYLHPTDPQTLRSYDSTLTLLHHIQALWPQHFAWNPPPYEYEETLMPIDILTGSDQVRAILPTPEGLDAIHAHSLESGDAWMAEVSAHLLYPH
jgi:uncharacterized protein YbbC (DUF1343 family)